MPHRLHLIIIGIFKNIQISSVAKLDKSYQFSKFLKQIMKLFEFLHFQGLVKFFVNARSLLIDLSLPTDLVENATISLSISLYL